MDVKVKDSGATAVSGSLRAWNVARASAPELQLRFRAVNGSNLLDNDPRKVSDRITAYALYIEHQLDRAGLTEEEVRKSGRCALIGWMVRIGHEAIHSSASKLMPTVLGKLHLLSDGAGAPQ
jgi:hypothetical protein